MRTDADIMPLRMDLEAERMDFQHMMFQNMYEGALFLSPIKLDANSSVLDAGTGTGLWAIDLADDNPNTKVIGVDLSAIQPAFVPPNAEFYIEDLEDPWTFSKPFDLIFARMLTGSIGDWPKFYRQSFEHLSPGGYIELTDIVFPIQCDDGTLDKDSALYQWGKLTVDAAAKLGRPLRTTTAVVSELVDAGFTDITQHHFKWPTNHWPKDPKMKELGAWTYEDVGKNVYGLTVALFTRGLGWTLEEFEVFLVQVRKEMRDPKIHGYFPIYAIHARKPDET
ncbi:related to methyltransferase [Cephalotrichum gorgonifer]|uniref:Related to methyltransferase n=1 Tax=Cephalotrichum gorgonifer TaxID=2041049 RepID=A0AAE8N5D1_9PEZI|nr:related to methyltransferase [Cephalotrichum gorgonifer]